MKEIQFFFKINKVNKNQLQSIRTNYSLWEIVN